MSDIEAIRRRDDRYWAEGYDPNLHDGRGRAALDRHALRLALAEREAEVARLREALTIIAAPDNGPAPNAISVTARNIARAALAGTPEPTP